MRRASLPSQFLEEQPAHPLFRHGQLPLNEQTYSHLTELICMTSPKGTSYGTFILLNEQVSKAIEA
jgi:hypothetical protein